MRIEDLLPVYSEQLTRRNPATHLGVSVLLDDFEFHRECNVLPRQLRAAAISN